ncbi:MAG: protein-L-isoaspartate(D-aspartate) O-methyltransferase [Calditrichaeota bacterium]|nr:protein-L-isoaspartate(D-aspartate) O-methyltransferase [Calditrichota bacterium]
MKSVFLLFCLLLLNSFCTQHDKEAKIVKTTNDDRFAVKRAEMVSQQIMGRGIKDTRVLTAMRKVPRHRFVPESEVKHSYDDDSPLPIGFEQTISQPYIVACMTEALHLTGSERVLEIGTGSGYQAAVLSELAKEVYTIEIVVPLCKRAKETLTKLGYHNVHILCSDGYEGWPEFAPFDAIIITAAPAHIPEPLLKQLKSGGRMVAPVGRLYQELVLITKDEQGVIKRKKMLPVRFVPMTGKAEQ